MIDKIIDNSNEQEPVTDFFPGETESTQLERRKGLPIGNLTSQFFCNVMLNQFDHFVKKQLKTKKYLRYVDDFALFSDDWNFLASAKQEIAAYLTTLKLKIHPIKTQLFETKQGVNFLGFRVLPDRIRVRNDNLRRSRRRLKQRQDNYRYGELSLDKLIQSLQSWEAHLNYGDTYRLRQAIFAHWTFTRQE